MTKADAIKIPKKEFIKEHKNLLKVLKSGDEKDLAKEFQDQLEEYKKVIGGRKGVTQASGFVMRMMAENKARPQGQYRKPTSLRADSKMNTPGIFEWKKLASPGQGGENQRGNPYGASPFITKHFKGDYVPFSARPYEPESKDQQVARYRFTAQRLLKFARELAGEMPQDLPGLTRAPAPSRASQTPAPSRPPSPPPAPRQPPPPPPSPPAPRQPSNAATSSSNAAPPPPAPRTIRLTETVEGEEEPVRRSELPEKWDIPFEIDTDDYDYREVFISKLLAKKPRATLEEIQAFLKKKLAEELRDEPEYPKFGTALSSIHEPVKRVREDMIEAYEHTKKMNARFDDILAKPGVSDKLKKLQEFLRRKATKKGQKEERETRWKRERVANKWQKLITDAIINPMRAERKADIQILYDEFKKYAPAYYAYRYEMFSGHKSNFTGYWGDKEMEKGWRQYYSPRLNEKWKPILENIVEKFPSLETDTITLDVKLGLPDGLEDYGMSIRELVRGWEKIPEDVWEKLSDKVVLDPGEEGYENPLMKKEAPVEEEEEEEEEAPSSTTSSSTTSSSSAPAEEERPQSIAKRDWRLIQIFKERPHISYFDAGKKLKAEGFDGVSASNLSIIIKKLREAGIWKLADWTKAYTERMEKMKRGGGSLDNTKRYINAKTPWTLSHLPKEQLKAYQASPEVPPSMKTKLDEALHIQGGAIPKLEITQEDLIGD